MFIICCGMYRSGSTWQYNVAAELYESQGRGERLGFLTAAGFAPRLDETIKPSEARLFKTHDTDPLFAAALASGKACGLYAYRDLRDVVFSMAHKLQRSVEHVMNDLKFVERCLENDRFWRQQPHVLVQRYQAITQAPALTVMEIASHLGVAVTLSQADDIATHNSHSANAARAETLTRQLRSTGVDLSSPTNALLYDPRTLLHWNHLREGATGLWRDLSTVEQRKALAALCGEWLIANGFEKDNFWIEHPAPPLQRTPTR